MIRRAEVEFFLRLHGLWEAIVALPPPPEPPFDVETMEPIEAPPHAIWWDDFEEFGSDRWTEADPAWAAPNSTSATVAASFSTHLSRSPRRNGRSPG